MSLSHVAIAVAIAWTVSTSRESLRELTVVVHATCEPGCALTQRLLTALRARLPTLRFERPTGLERPDALMTLEQKGEGWTLRIESSGGEILLQRELETSDDPANIVEACGLMLDRFLDDLQGVDSSESLTLPPRPEPPPPAPLLEPEPVEESRVAAWLGAGALVSYEPEAATWGVGGALRASVSPTDWLEVGSTGELRAPQKFSIDESEVRLGTLHLLPLTLLVTAGGCLAVADRTDVCLDLLGGAVLSWAWMSGDELFRRSSTRISQPAGGLGGRLCRELPFEMQLEVIARLLGRVGGRALAVEGIAEPAYRSQPLDVTLSVLITRRIF